MKGLNTKQAKLLEYINETYRDTGGNMMIGDRYKATAKALYRRKLIWLNSFPGYTSAKPR